MDGAPESPIMGIVIDHTMTPIATVLSRLQGVKPAGQGKWVALCPAHGGLRTSLSVAEKDGGRVLIHCFTGCNIEDVVRVIELEMRDLFKGSSPRKEGGGWLLLLKPLHHCNGMWLDALFPNMLKPRSSL